MRLVELEPRFLRTAPTPEAHSFHDVAALADAQGIMFLCPHCFRANAGPVGTHSILVWFAGRGAPEIYTPAPRWAFSGTGMDDLTLQPSISVSGCWHGFVTNGEVTFC